MRTTRIYSAEVNGTFTQIKAYNKTHALKGFRVLDPSVNMSDITILNTSNSHQGVWDEV